MTSSGAIVPGGSRFVSNGSSSNSSVNLDEYTFSTTMPDGTPAVGRIDYETTRQTPAGVPDTPLTRRFAQAGLFPTQGFGTQQSIEPIRRDPNDFRPQYSSAVGYSVPGGRVEMFTKSEGIQGDLKPSQPKTFAQQRQRDIAVQRAAFADYWQTEERYRDAPLRQRFSSIPERAGAGGRAFFSIVRPGFTQTGLAIEKYADSDATRRAAFVPGQEYGRQKIKVLGTYLREQPERAATDVAVGYALGGVGGYVVGRGASYGTRVIASQTGRKVGGITVGGIQAARRAETTLGVTLGAGAFGSLAVTGATQGSDEVVRQLPAFAAGGLGFVKGYGRGFPSRIPRTEQGPMRVSGVTRTEFSGRSFRTEGSGTVPVKLTQYGATERYNIPVNFLAEGRRTGGQYFLGSRSLKGQIKARGARVEVLNEKEMRWQYGNGYKNVEGFYVRGLPDRVYVAERAAKNANTITHEKGHLLYDYYRAESSPSYINSKAASKEVRNLVRSDRAFTIKDYQERGYARSQVPEERFADFFANDGYKNIDYSKYPALTNAVKRTLAKREYYYGKVPLSRDYYGSVRAVGAGEVAGKEVVLDTGRFDAIFRPVQARGRESFSLSSRSETIDVRPTTITGFETYARQPSTGRFLFGASGQGVAVRRASGVTIAERGSRTLASGRVDGERFRVETGESYLLETEQGVPRVTQRSVGVYETRPFSYTRSRVQMLKVPGLQATQIAGQRVRAFPFEGVTASKAAGGAPPGLFKRGFESFRYAGAGATAQAPRRVRFEPLGRRGQTLLPSEPQSTFRPEDVRTPTTIRPVRPRLAGTIEGLGMAFNRVSARTPARAFFSIGSSRSPQENRSMTTFETRATAFRRSSSIIPLPGTIQPQIVDTPQRSSLVTRSGFREITVPDFTPGQGFTPITSVPPPPPPPEFPVGGGFPLIFAIPPGRGGGDRGAGRRSFKYAPSITAALFNIQGRTKRRGPLTGFELRPIVRGR